MGEILDTNMEQEVCVASFNLNSKLVAIDLIDLTDLQEGSAFVTEGIYATAFITSPTRH